MNRAWSLSALIMLAAVFVGCTSTANTQVQTAVTLSPTPSSTIAVTLSATPQPTTNSPAPTLASPSATPTPTTTPSPTNPTAITRVTVGASDNGFEVNTLSAPAGNTVELTFDVDQDDVYYGGLQMKCPLIAYDSGKVPPGGTAMATFTMPSSPVVCTAYWPSSGVKKGDLTLTPA